MGIPIKFYQDKPKCQGVLKFYKKPVQVEALWVLDGYRNLKAIVDFVGAANLCPIERRPDYTLKIKTLEGPVPVHPGEWIIKGVAGEFYPCKPAIFEATYTMAREVS